MTIEYVSMDENIANIMIRALCKEKFTNIRKKILISKFLKFKNVNWWLKVYQSFNRGGVLRFYDIDCVLFILLDDFCSGLFNVNKLNINNTSVVQ